MKVAIALRFPIVHPVTGMHDWQEATVITPGSNLTPVALGRFIERTYSIWGREGSLGSVIGLAQLLRDEAHDGFELVRPSVTILWGDASIVDFPDGIDLTICMDYDDGKVIVNNGDEFRMRDLAGDDNYASPDNRIDWPAEFVKSIESAVCAG